MTDTSSQRSAVNDESVVAASHEPTGAPSARVSTTPEKPERARSLGRDAWQELRGRPLFWMSAGLILLFVLMAIFPQLFTRTDPRFADLSKARERPSGDAWFGRDGQGYDVYARTIYGARASILVGLFATLFTLIVGSTIGIISGYRGGWLDAVISRIGEIFLGIPGLLGGILFLYVFPSDLDTPFIAVVGKVAVVLGLLGWPVIARLMRSSVLQVKPNDYVQAARALGAYISVEATLSFLGIGLQAPAISWGIAISEASGIGLIRAAPHMLVFPSIFLSLTVLAFIMLGDAVRDALDPKLR